MIFDKIKWWIKIQDIEQQQQKKIDKKKSDYDFKFQNEENNKENKTSSIPPWPTITNDNNNRHKMMLFKTKKKKKKRTMTKTDKQWFGTSIVSYRINQKDPRKTYSRIKQKAAATAAAAVQWCSAVRNGHMTSLVIRQNQKLGCKNVKKKKGGKNDNYQPTNNKQPKKS